MYRIAQAFVQPIAFCADALLRLADVVVAGTVAFVRLMQIFATGDTLGRPLLL